MDGNGDNWMEVIKRSCVSQCVHQCLESWLHARAGVYATMAAVATLVPAAVVGAERCGTAATLPQQVGACLVSLVSIHLLPMLYTGCGLQRMNDRSELMKQF